MPRRTGQDRSLAKREFAVGLGRAIKVLRTSQDLSRRGLAERSGLSYSYLAEIENGAKSPSSRALAGIANGLGLQTHELVEAAETWGATPPKAMAPKRDTGEARAPAPPSSVDLAARLLGEPPDYGARRPDERLMGEAPAAEDEPALSLSETMFASPTSPGEALDGIPADLLNEIQAGNCVAFVGAGFSAAANLPAWGRLLTEIAERAGVARATSEHVADCVDRGSANALDEAAQVLEDELGRARFIEQLEAILGHPPMPPAMLQRIRWLHGIPFRSILTTNFDGILEGETTSHDAYRNALRPEAHRWWNPRYWDETEGAYTLKLHGDVSPERLEDESVVLTRRDYRRRLYADPAYESFLRAVMATTTVLYLGFSFEDAYLNELRSEILALLGQRSESAPVAYAIVNDVPEETSRHFRRHEGVEILSYDTRGGRDFTGFDAYLRAIYDATNPLLRFARYLEHKRILWIDPHPENNELAFAHLARAAHESGRERTALVMVPTADDGLRELEAAPTRAPFDLAITHWGGGAARDEAGHPTSTAERLLTGIRSRDLRCPVVVFAGWTEVELRKRTALGLGAQAYCFEFEDLYQVIERVLSPD